MNISIQQLESIKCYLEDFAWFDTYEQAKEKGYAKDYEHYLKLLARKRNKRVIRSRNN